MLREIKVNIITFLIIISNMRTQAFFPIFSDFTIEKNLFYLMIEN